MKVLVVGATGGTGRCLVEQALEAGHEVTALARHPPAVTTQHPRLKVLEGDVLVPATLDAAVRGQDAVVSALGTRGVRANTVRSDGTRNLVEAMKRAGVKRIVAVSSAGVGDSMEQMRRSSRILGRFLIPWFLRHVLKDLDRLESVLRDSGLEWVVVRPVGLTNEPRTGRVRAVLGAERITFRVPRADVAEFMLRQLGADAMLGQAPTLFTFSE